MHDRERGHVLTVGGLFSGIGGWELGLERAGMRVLWHCEADPYARAVLERHWPGVPCYPDVRDLRGADVEPVDVLAGGFPCQDLSYAGAGAGIDGARSGLWSEYARVVGEVRPRYVLVENVPALLGRGLGRVLGDLAALGYDAEWDCLPAAAFGAPHLRDRIWLVAYPGGDDGGSRRPGRPAASGAREPEPVGALSLADANGARLEGHGRPDERAGELAAAARGRSCGAGELADAEGQRREPRPGFGNAVGAGQLAAVESEGRAALPPSPGRRADYWAAEPDVGRVAHGVPVRVDRLRCLGNALVPQIAEWIGDRVTAFEEARLADAAPSAPRGPGS